MGHQDEGVGILILGSIYVSVFDITKVYVDFTHIPEPVERGFFSRIDPVPKVWSRLRLGHSSMQTDVKCVSFESYIRCGDDFITEDWDRTI